MESDVKPYVRQYCLFSAIDIEKFLDSDLPNDLKMALIRKLFKRNKKNVKIEETSPIYAEIEDKLTMRRVAPILSEHAVDAAGSLSIGSLDEIIPGGTDVDHMIENEENTKRKQLNNVLRKVR